jgi:hypothetical protein
MTPRPILSDAEIEQFISATFPVMPGERTCAFERRKMNEIRTWKRKQLYAQNKANEQYNQRLLQQSGR